MFLFDMTYFDIMHHAVPFLCHCVCPLSTMYVRLNAM